MAVRPEPGCTLRDGRTPVHGSNTWPASRKPGDWAPFRDLVGRALLGSLAGAALTVVASVLTLRSGYAGAHDEGAVTQAVEKYQAFLAAVGQELMIIGAAEALCLTPFTVGLLLLLERLLVTRLSAWRRLVLAVGAGVAVVCAYALLVAHRYPGLFLSVASGSHLLTWAVRHGRGLASLTLAGSALGYASLLQARQNGPSARSAAGLLILVTAGGVSAWERLPAPELIFRNPDVKALEGRGEQRPNILILAVDSLRPDMIDPAHTPNIARLVQESIYFPNALVTVPRTGPSWAATLTSMSPLLNGIETMFPSAQLTKLTTLAMPAHLASLGYRTAVFSEYAGEFFGRVELGFQVKAVPTVDLKEITGQMLLLRAPTVLAAAAQVYTQGGFGRALLGARMTNLMRGMSNFSHPEVLDHDVQVLASLDRRFANEQRAPIFSLIFYSQPHFPYTSSSDFYPRYAVPGSSPELAFGRDATNETPVTSAADHAQLVGLYRAALAETDAAIGTLVDRMRATGQLERTIVVLLADHGEGLYECSTCVGHGDNLRSMLTLRVPLAFRLPSSVFGEATPARQDAYVSQLDVYPTILSLLGQEGLVHHEGVALLNDHGQPMSVPPRTHFAETGEWLWPTPAVPKDRIAYPSITRLASLEGHRIVIDEKFGPEIRAAKYRAVIRPPYKLSYEPGASQVSYHLYRIDRDPYDDNDLATVEPAVLEDLKGQLSASMLRDPRILPVAGYFLTRPESPAPESW
jgi:hypothetical protein